jgi:hypothetical protein
MARQRACIYCRTGFRATHLTAEPVVPTALGGRLLLERAACLGCAERVRGVADDFLATRFALTTAAMATTRGRPGSHVGPTSDSPVSSASAEEWRRADRAAAKILYCYLLLELGASALSSGPSEVLRRHLLDDEHPLGSPLGEVTAAPLSPSRRWHVLMFDSARSAAAVGLFGTIWFRFRLDLAALAPHGRLVVLDAVRGARGMAALRGRRGWRYRPAVRWGWSG